MNGILIIDKPENFTSHDVVARLRRILKTKKIGHTGTLDPFATGVLVMLVGKATRLAQFLDKDEKSYETKIHFGFETDTGDKTGTPKTESVAADIEIEDIETVLPKFRGEIEQIPPMYSAKKVKGKKLYELARKGVEIGRKPVKLNISKLEVADYSKFAENELIIKVACSAGTYIRTLAEDIGKSVGCPCHLTELRRIKAGKFDISQSISIEELEKIVENSEIEDVLISMNNAVLHLPKKIVNQDELKRVQNGMRISADFTDEPNVRIVDENNNLIAIGHYLKKERQIQPRIVF